MSLNEHAAGVPGWHCRRCGPLDSEGLALYREPVYNLHSRRFGPWCRGCGGRVLFENPSALPAPGGAAVLLLSGSCASGKSTVSWLLAERHGLVQVDGDWVLALGREEAGRENAGRDETGRATATLDVDDVLLTMAEGLAWLGHSPVVAHVILPAAMPRYAAFLERRRILWRLVLLMPRREELLERTRTRRTWPHPTPAYWVHHFYDALLEAPAGEHTVVHDNTDESPEQTAEALWRLFGPLARTL